MFNHSDGHIVKKPLGFFAASALGLSAVLVTTIFSATGIALYGLRVVDKKTGNLIELVQEAARTIPELREALPPALADAIEDVRAPEYRDSLRVSAGLSAAAEPRGWRNATIEIENKGSRTISLMSMRIVGLDQDGAPTQERQVWAATPLQIDGDWRGPLLPQETRRLVVRGFSDKNVSRIVPEITEVRVWDGPIQNASAM